MMVGVSNTNRSSKGRSRHANPLKYLPFTPISCSKNCAFLEVGQAVPVIDEGEKGKTIQGRDNVVVSEGSVLYNLS
jgi:hypothetical protein